jgi:hypothetical protein
MQQRYTSRRKWGNHKCEYQNIIFDSTKERDRFIVLSNRLACGEISNLQTQVPFVIIPRLEHDEQVQLKTKVKIKKVLDFIETKYIADFTYYDREGNFIVEDVKGSKATITPEFRLKQKLMLHVHGIKVRLIFKANE